MIRLLEMGYHYGLNVYQTCVNKNILSMQTMNSKNEYARQALKHHFSQVGRYRRRSREPKVCCCNPPSSNKTLWPSSPLGRGWRQWDWTQKSTLAYLSDLTKLPENGVCFARCFSETYRSYILSPSFPRPRSHRVYAECLYVIRLLHVNVSGLYDW